MVGCLILHGYTGGPYEVDPLADYIEKETNWNVVVPTLPGHGEELDLVNFTHQDWLKSAEEQLIQLLHHNKKNYLIGFSMGGMIAAYLAAKYQVEKLVLLAPAGKYLSMKRLTIEVRDMIKDGIVGNLANNYTYLNYRKKWGEVPLKSTIEFMKLVKYTRDYLEKVETPVLIAQGQHDGIVPAKTVHYLDKVIASKEKEIILFDRSKHLICLGEDKDILNRLILNFLVEEQSN